MIFHSANGQLSDCNLKRAGGIDHAVHIIAGLDRLHGGEGEAYVNCDAGHDQVLATRLLDRGYDLSYLTAVSVARGGADCVGAGDRVLGRRSLNHMMTT